MKRLIAGFVASAFIWIGVASIRALATSADGRLTQCAAGPGSGNQVQAAFEIPAASRIWDYFPAMLESPELARDDNRAYVVVFEGDFHSPFGGAPTSRRPRIYRDVICVIHGDGEATIYADVSRVGYRQP